MTLLRGGLLLGSPPPGLNWGLLRAPFRPGGAERFTTTKQFHALAQFSRHIQPGSRLLPVEAAGVVPGPPPNRPTATPPPTRPYACQPGYSLSLSLANLAEGRPPLANAGQGGRLAGGGIQCVWRAMRHSFIASGTSNMPRQKLTTRCPPMWLIVGATSAWMVENVGCGDPSSAAYLPGHGLTLVVTNATAQPVFYTQGMKLCMFLHYSNFVIVPLSLSLFLPEKNQFLVEIALCFFRTAQSTKSEVGYSI